MLIERGKMEFTYGAYKNLIKKLKEKGYIFCDYENHDLNKRVIILRHDVDTSLEKALKIAEVENELGVRSYFFILLSTDFYNVNSEKSLAIIEKIISLGGKIGLHFDEKKYKISSKLDYFKYVDYEVGILSNILRYKINAVSMHRPSKRFLEMNLEFPNIINSYQKKFFNDFKYVSDSRMFWRENIEELIEEKKYQKFHILTHPFWYAEEIEDMDEKIKRFLHSAIEERFDSLSENIRNFEEIISKEKIYGEY